MTDHFYRLAADAGLPPIRLHDLRHVAATIALEAGVDIKVVQEDLGHSTSMLTRDTYTSVSPRLAKSPPRRPRQPSHGPLVLDRSERAGRRISQSLSKILGALSIRENAQVNKGGPPGTRTQNQWIKSPLLCH